MIYLTSVVLICKFCNAEIERATEKEAHIAMNEHRKYVRCDSGCSDG